MAASWWSSGAARASSLCTLVLPLLASAQPDSPRLGVGITPETTRRVFDALSVVQGPGCTLEGVKTSRQTLLATFLHEGTALPPVRIRVIAVAGAKPGAAATVRLEAEVPEPLTKSCPAAARAVAALAPVLAAAPARGESRPGNVAPLGLIVAVQVVVLALIAWSVARAARRRERLSREWLLVIVGGFLLAWIVRLALPSAPSNWYLDVLPPTGPPASARFGPGAYAIPALLRALGLWSEPALFALVRLIGAAAVAVLALLLRECAVPPRAAALACALLALSPLHARVSASGSDHVLASTLTLAAAFTWLRATRRRDPLLGAVTVGLAALAVSTRVETSFQIATVALWPLLRDRAELAAGYGRAPWRATAALATALAALAAGAYLYIALPAQHPWPPWHEVLRALRLVFTQFLVASLETPTWVPSCLVGMTLLALVPALWRRPLLVARVVVVMLLTFVPLGRLLDRPYLVELRYFLFVLAVASVPAAVGLEALLARVAASPRWWRRALSLAIPCALVGVAAYQTRTGFTARFTYEDEYVFLRTALASLPEGCAVYATPQRGPLLRLDPDCCLDVPHSPLPLAFPALRFTPLPVIPAPRDDAASCAVYYESALCSGRDEPGPRGRESLRAYTAACREQRGMGTFRPLAQRRVSPLSTNRVFDAAAPTVTLYRWER